MLATAPGFLGPAIYGLIAWSALDASTRSGAIREAEALLQAGSVSHNHLLFGRYATEAAISAGDWREAARLAAELERYGAGEPVPWAEFFVRRTKALAEHARAPTSMTRQVLTELRADATASGIHCVLPTLDAAISAG